MGTYTGHIGMSNYLRDYGNTFKVLRWDATDFAFLHNDGVTTCFISLSAQYMVLRSTRQLRFWIGVYNSASWILFLAKKRANFCTFFWPRWAAAKAWNWSLSRAVSVPGQAVLSTVRDIPHAHSNTALAAWALGCSAFSAACQAAVWGGVGWWWWWV